MAPLIQADGEQLSGCMTVVEIKHITVPLFDNNF